MAKQQKKKKIKHRRRSEQADRIPEPDQGKTLEAQGDAALKDSFELYAEWPLLQNLLVENLFPLSTELTNKKPKDVIILVPRCGNSKLSEHLYDAGFHSIMNVDSSDAVIRDMLNRNVRDRPEMKWRVMNMTPLLFHDESFDVVLDKGGLDALMEPKLRQGSGNRYLSEVKRVLKAGGKFICLTLAESHVLDLLFPKFRFGWKVSLHVIGQEPQCVIPRVLTFAVVVEKDSPSAISDISSFLGEYSVECHGNQAHELYEVLGKERKIRTEYSTNSDIAYSIEELKFGAKGNIKMLQPGRRIKIILGDPGVSKFLYSGVLLDAKQDSEPFTHRYGVAVVPKLRAHNWLYTSERGQWIIAKSTKAARVLMVLLDSSNSIFSMKAIQTDLYPLVKQLTPRYGDNDPPLQIPFLSIGDGIKKRDVVHQVISDMTGPIMVMDVIYEKIQNEDPFKDHIYRRLTFGTSVNLVQSEALLSTKSDSLSSMSHEEVSIVKAELNHNYLGSPYHNRIISGILLISSYLNVDLVKTVVVGLGGGLLPMFMKKNLPTLEIEVVELDPVVLDVSREYFGFEEDERLKVHIADGYQFVRERANSELEGKNSCRIDILIVDADSSNTSSGLTCPGASFIDESFMLAAKESLSEHGIFVINLVSRSSVVKGVVYSRLKKVFGNIFGLTIEKDYNEALFALKIDHSNPEVQLLKAQCVVGQYSDKVNEFWIQKAQCLAKSINVCLDESNRTLFMKFGLSR